MKKYNTTLEDLFNTRNLIIQKDILNLQFSRKGGLLLARNIRKIEEELKEYVKSRDELIMKYSEDGSTISKSNEKWDEFNKEYKEIGCIAVCIDIDTISCEELPEKISASACASIDFMIEE